MKIIIRNNRYVYRNGINSDTYGLQVVDARRYTVGLRYNIVFRVRLFRQVKGRFNTRFIVCTNIMYGLGGAGWLNGGNINDCIKCLQTRIVSTAFDKNDLNFVD